VLAIALTVSSSRNTSSRIIISSSSIVVTLAVAAVVCNRSAGRRRHERSSNRKSGKYCRRRRRKSDCISSSTGSQKVGPLTNLLLLPYSPSFTYHYLHGLLPFSMKCEVFTGKEICFRVRVIFHTQHDFVGALPSAAAYNCCMSCMTLC